MGVQLLLTFEHNPLWRQVLHDPGDNICSPAVDVFGDAFAFNHETLHTGIKEFLTEIDKFPWIAGADCFKLACRGVWRREKYFVKGGSTGLASPRLLTAAGAELDTQLWLSLDSIGVDFVDES
jgi:hypothetical protein